MGSCSGQKKSLLFKDCGCGCKGKNQEKKFLIALMSALLFFVIANPETFRLVRKIFGSWVSTPTGCPSTKGLAFHSLVFLLISWAMMNIKKEAFEIEGKVTDKVKAEIKEEVKAEVKAEVEAEVKAEVEQTIKAPPAMVDMPEPLPGMAEEQFAMIDTGLSLGSLDTTDNTVLPKPAEYKSGNGKTVTCSCEDDKKVVISN